MNLLIVDDEAPAARAVLNIVNWKKLPIDQIYVAYSIWEAMKKFEENAVHLLLTDIKMPGGSGFELIQWCKARYPKCVIMILSSFPDFKFAQRAITLGVFEYLLKPVEKEEFEAVLCRAVRFAQNVSAEHEPVSEKPLISELKKYIDDHISQDISRNELSDYAKLSPEYLSVYFKKETGCTISAFIRQERISFAKRLLLHTNLPVSTIAQSVGYDSLAYFSATFKQITGTTPREYRRVREQIEEA